MNKKLLLCLFLFFLGEHESLLRGVPPEFFRTAKASEENFSGISAEERTAVERRLTSPAGEETSNILEEDADDESEQGEFDEPAPPSTRTASWKGALKRVALLNLILSAKGIHAQEFMPSTCLQAAALHEQASSISHQTTAACFEIMKAYSNENQNMGPHHEAKELAWEKSFQASTIAKQAWMQAEEKCQQDLARIFHGSHSEATEKTDETRWRQDCDQGCMSPYRSDQNSTTTQYSSALAKLQTENHERSGLGQAAGIEREHHWWQHSWSFSASRLEQWTDPARWHCSPLENAFRNNLDNHPFACVVDSSEVDGPEPGQKTERKIVKENFEDSSYTLIVNTINVATGKLIAKADMSAGRILVDLKKGIDPESVRKKLADLDSSLSIVKDLPYEDSRGYSLYFQPNSTRLFYKILEESRHLLELESIYPNNISYQGPWDRGYAGLLGRDYIPRCTFHLPENDLKQRAQTVCRNAFELYRESTGIAGICLDAARENVDSHNKEQKPLLEKIFQEKKSQKESWLQAEAICQEALEKANAIHSLESWWKGEWDALQRRLNRACPRGCNF